MIYRAGFLFLLLHLPAAQAGWGRLFYTPEQRTALVRDMQADASAATGQNAASLHHYTGAMQRAGGRPLHWIDGQLSPGIPPKHVKPGERWDSVSDRVYPAGRRPGKE